MMKIENLSDKKLDNIFNEIMHNALSEGKELTVECLGNCMEPLLKDGDRVSFKKVDINRLKWLDIIIFIGREKNNLVTHRFIKTTHNNGRIYIFTTSDVSGKYDHLTAEEDFVGLITKIEKPDKIIYLNTLKGRLRSYINILIAPLFPLIKKMKPKQKKEYFKDENELLALISNVNMDKRSMPGAKEILSKSLNWNYISERIKWNFIAPFFLKNIINNRLKDQIPAGIQEKVKQICARQVYRDTKIYSELKNALGAFNRNNIRIMIIKGAHLGEEVYGNTFLRWMGDIDILAKLDDWLRIKDILQRIGFKYRGGDYDYWGLNCLDNHIAFFKDGVKLEVKFNIWLMDFPYFKNDIWKDAREILISGEKIYAPSLEDTLLIACINLTRHNYAGLIWFCDIREIISRFKDRIDWDKIIKRAKKRDINCMVYHALYYSSRLLNYEIPEDILKRLKPPLIKKWLHNFFWNEKIILWKKEGYPSRAKIAFEVATFLFGGKINFKPKKLLKMLLYISSVIMPNRAHLSRRCQINRNSPKLIFYYLLQPFRFVLIMLDNLVSLMLSRKSRIVR